MKARRGFTSHSTTIFALAATSFHSAMLLRIMSANSSGVVNAGAIAEAGQPLGDIGLGKDLLHRRRQRGNDALVELGRAEEAGPRLQVEVGIARLGHGRHIGQHRHALPARHRQRAQLAGLDQRDGDVGADERDAQRAVHHVGRHGRVATIGHMDDVDARHRLEPFRCRHGSWRRRPRCRSSACPGWPWRRRRTRFTVLYRQRRDWRRG